MNFRFLSNIRFRGLPILVFMLPLLALSQTNSQSQNPGSAAYQSQSVLRATTRLVILDVVVTDDKGNPVPDLKAEDFTVLEDGKPQQLIDFSFQHPTTSAQNAPKLAPNVVSNIPTYSSASSLNVILLDAINTDFSSHAYAQEMLIKYLESGPAIQPTAVYALEARLRLLHDFTTDTRELRDVVAHFKPQGPTHIPDVYSAATPFSRRGSFQVSDQGRNATFNSMRFLARALSGYPGRKNLIWLSEAFPLSLFPETTMGEGAFLVVDFSPAMERVADELMNAQVALYPIDAAGVSINDRFPARTGMLSMSERTGGKTFYNRNDIDLGVRTSINDGSTYYNMQYYPQNKQWDGRFRKIEVKVNRPGIQLRYRQGYFALAPDSRSMPSTATSAHDLGTALAPEAPGSAAVLFQAAVDPPVKGQSKILVKFGIDPHTIAFRQSEDGMEHAAIDCVVWAYKGGDQPAQTEAHSVNADLDPKVYAEVMKSYLPCSTTVELKHGEYNLRLGVIDQQTKLIGSLGVKLVVP